jgi:AcrR family transcriptional regulator
MNARSASRRPGRPRGEEVGQGERKAEILAAARQLFEQRGYAAVAVSDVAAEVGVTKAAIHHHFATKADLYAAVMRGVLTGIELGIRGMMVTPGPVRAKLHDLASFAIIALQSNADLDAMMRDADEHLNDAQRHELNQARAAIAAALTDLMREGIDRGELAPADPAFLAHAFWHLVAAFAGRTGAVRGYQGRPEIATAVVDMFVHGAGPVTGRGGSTAE